jgi:type IV secretion system protein TrbL
VWTFSKLALKQTDFGEFAAELIRWIVITGFFFSLVLYSVDWATAIINSFRQAAASAAGVSMQLQPGDMFALAIELGRTVARIGLADPVTSVVVALSATLIVACFTFIAAFMMVTLIESYVVINAGVFFMAFGGSEWTREYAMAMVRYSVSVGAKLFVLTLIVGVIMTSARTWEAAYHNDETSMLTMVGLALVCAYISKTLPDMIQALINGVSASGGSQIGGMMAAGVAGVAAGAAATSAAIGNKFMGGGVTDAIKSSFSGFTGGSGGSSAPGSFMNSGGGGGGSGGGSSGRSYGQSPRTGGGGYSQAPSTPPSAQPSGPSSSGGQASSSSSGQAESSNSPASGATSTAQKIHAGAHMAADTAVRSVGTMGALAVPGMEGAAGTSIGPAPTLPDLTPMPGDTPENIIRPESPSPSMGEAAGDAPQEAAAKPAPADTMASIQEALNNRGKTV